MKLKTISGKNGKVVLPDGSTISHEELEKEADQWASGNSSQDHPPISRPATPG